MTIGDAPSEESGSTHSDLMIGTVAVVTTFFLGFFGFYSAIKSEIKDATTDVTKMLESKIDGQDRKIAGQDRTIAAQERKVEIFGEKIDLQYLKYILSKTNWSWFGLNSSPVKSENDHVIDVVSTVADSLNTKFEVIHDATKNLGTEVNILGTEIETMRKELNAMRNKPNVKTNDGISSGSKK